jgi:hypothetical protein
MRFVVNFLCEQTLASCLSSRREEKKNNKGKWEPGNPMSPSEHRANTEAGISCAYEIEPIPNKIMNANQVISKPKSWSSNGRPHSRQFGLGEVQNPASAQGAQTEG